MFSYSSIRLSGEQVQVTGHMTLETMCGEGANAKAIEVIYLIVDVMSTYNIILGHASIGPIISTQ